MSGWSSVAVFYNTDEGSAELKNRGLKPEFGVRLSSRVFSFIRKLRVSLFEKAVFCALGVHKSSLLLHRFGLKLTIYKRFEAKFHIELRFKGRIL
jgi:hypothetical protein